MVVSSEKKPAKKKPVTPTGAKRAFEDLVEKYFGIVYAVAYGRLGHPETAEDLAQVVRMLNNNGMVNGNQILSQTGRDNMVLSGIGINLGGFTAQNTRYTHGGTNEGFRSVLVGFPAIGAGVVVMTNGDAGGTAFRGEIAQAVINAYGW